MAAMLESRGVSVDATSLEEVLSADTADGRWALWTLRGEPGGGETRSGKIVLLRPDGLAAAGDDCLDRGPAESICLTTMSVQRWGAPIALTGEVEVGADTVEMRYESGEAVRAWVGRGRFLAVIPAVGRLGYFETVPDVLASRSSDGNELGRLSVRDVVREQVEFLRREQPSS
jgi:hypothetical protein